MNHTVILFLIILSMAACSSTKKVVEQTPKSVEPVITLSPPIVIKDTVPPKVFKIDTLLKITKTECYGKCPVYDFAILNEGTVLWNGVKHTDKIGSFVSKLNKEQLDELETTISKNNIQQLSNQYPIKTHELITDLPNTIFKFFIVNKEVKVNHSMPSILKTISKKLENWLAESDWIKLEP